VARDRRIFLETPDASFRQVFEYAVNALEFRHLCMITGLDEGDPQGAALRKPGANEVSYAMALPALKPGDAAEVLTGLWVPARIGKADERLTADNGGADRRVLLGRVKAGPDGAPAFEAAQAP